MKKYSKLNNEGEYSQEEKLEMVLRMRQRELQLEEENIARKQREEGEKKEKERQRESFFRHVYEAVKKEKKWNFFDEIQSAS